MGKTIPVTIMNEHRDAYWHWHWIIDQGIVPHDGNYLLHIDHHDDFEGRGYRGDLFDPPESADEAKRITDKSLGIADFIVPAVWHGIFTTVHILKNTIPKAVTSEEYFLNFIRVDDDSYIKKGKYIPFLYADKRKNADGNYRFFNVVQGGLNSTDNIPPENVVLDVDLDYFSWDDSLSTSGPKRMEITEAAWNEYHSNRDHPFRILPKKLIYPVEENGRYYLEYHEVIPKSAMATCSRIEKRMDSLFDWFDKTGLCPAAIDICRSSVSGYMPQDNAGFTEKEFLRRVEERWNINTYGL